jgi:hypothetical protein
MIIGENFAPDKRHIRSRILGLVVMLAIVAGASPLFGQSDEHQNEGPSSDLGRENFSHVAASAAELKAVLVKDTGLMVELKRWLAKDATDHGQVISDADLTNEAIFERLEADTQFRSLATRIVQQYGYLLPQVNPDSEMGKERALLIQERTKWLAQNQEEELAASRQRELLKLQQAKSCQTSGDTDCETNEQKPAPVSTVPPQGNGPSNAPTSPAPPFLINPVSPASPNEMQPPVMPGGQLLQASTEGSDNFGIGLSAGAAGQSKSPFDLNDDSQGESTTGGALRQRLSNDPLSQLNAEFAMQNGDSGMSGLMGGNGVDGFGSGLTSLGNFDLSQSNNSVPANSPLLAMKRNSNLRPPNARLEPIEMVRTQTPYTDIPSLYDMYLQAVPRFSRTALAILS